MQELFILLETAGFFLKLPKLCFLTFTLSLCTNESQCPQISICHTLLLLLKFVKSVYNIKLHMLLSIKKQAVTIKLIIVCWKLFTMIIVLCFCSHQMVQKSVYIWGQVQDKVPENTKTKSKMYEDAGSQEVKRCRCVSVVFTACFCCSQLGRLLSGKAGIFLKVPRFQQIIQSTKTLGNMRVT